jgi:hypothetical protein
MANIAQGSQSKLQQLIAQLSGLQQSGAGSIAKGAAQQEIEKTQPGPDYPTVRKEFPQGMAQFYDDSYLRLLEGLRAGEGPSQQLQGILERFKGKPGNLEDFMGRAGPFIAGSLGGTQPFNYLQNFQGIENPMQAYGRGAGMIGQGAAQGLQGAQNRLGRAGLGRSAAMSGLASRAASGASAQQANLYTDLYQATQQKQAANAQRAFDLHRQIAQMALGQNMTPRVDGGGGGPSQVGGAISGALGGAGAGFGIGGPVGGVIGGLLGGVGGALS